MNRTIIDLLWDDRDNLRSSPNLETYLTNWGRGNLGPHLLEHQRELVLAHYRTIKFHPELTHPLPKPLLLPERKTLDKLFTATFFMPGEWEDAFFLASPYSLFIGRELFNFWVKPRTCLLDLCRPYMTDQKVGSFELIKRHDGHLLVARDAEHIGTAWIALLDLPNLSLSTVNFDRDGRWTQDNLNWFADPWSASK